MKSVFIIFLNCLFLLWMIIGLFASREDTNKLVAFRNNLTLIYEEPKLENNASLWEMVTEYLNVLRRVEPPAQARDPEAIETIRVICTKGGPQHIDDVPYEDFAKLFHWTSQQTTKFKQIIDDTQKVFDDLVDIAIENRTQFTSSGEIV